MAPSHVRYQAAPRTVLVRATGFEPVTPSSQSSYSARLSYTRMRRGSGSLTAFRGRLRRDPSGYAHPTSLMAPRDSNPELPESESGDLPVDLEANKFSKVTPTRIERVFPS